MPAPEPASPILWAFLGRGFSFTQIFVYFSVRRNVPFWCSFEVSMKKLVIVTYVLRALGFVLVLLMLFGHSIVLNIFPGLEGQSINPIFYTGVACYAVGAIIHFFIKKQEREERRKREIAEASERAFGKKSDDSDK
jgi:mannose/fructose/N-acetylgalactosamine-specific phosphotransferase system component IIC